MEPAPDASPPEQLQKGYRAVPLCPAGEGGPLQVCLVVREVANPVAGIFVLLRDAFDASIYLGCLADAAGYLHEWLEVWVQNTSRIATQLEALTETLTNAQLDERWRRRVEIFTRLDRAAVLALPLEKTPGRPVFYDLDVTAPLHPGEPESGGGWVLCRDDALLAQHGLPAYATSLARYLHLPGRASGAVFLPVTDGAPENKWTRPVSEAIGPLLPFNPAGGAMMVRKLAPLAFEAYLDLLGGQRWSGIEQGEKVFRLDGVYRTLLDAEGLQAGRGYLLWTARGASVRVLESFTVKIELLLQCFRLVRDWVREERLPFLNLTAESFRLRLADISSTLPFFWTAQVELARPGAAVELSIPGSPGRWFAAPGAGVLSAWRPGLEMRVRSFTGSVGVGKVSFQEDGTASLQGTLSTVERIAAQPGDLLCLRLTLSSGRVDIYAPFGEGTHFESLPLRLPEAVHPALRSAEGITFTNVPMTTLPMVSTPLDLYALGVAGVRTLLVHAGNPLDAALGEIMGLARSLPPGGEGLPSLAERVGAIANPEPRWRDALGPQHLLALPAGTAADCFAHLPSELWWETVAALLQCFPGSVPEAFCAHFGDASPDAPAAIFERPIAQLESLLRRSRSLLFGDRAGDSEIHALLRQALEETPAT